MMIDSHSQGADVRLRCRMKLALLVVAAYALVGISVHAATSTTVVRSGYFVEIWVPAGYDAHLAPVPVIYQLDGQNGGAGTLMQMIEEAGAKAILVAIHDMGRRQGDFNLPGAYAFLPLLTKDVIPFIESNYRADPAKRVLAGHSLSGNFVFHALYAEAPGPFSFSHYWAADGAFWTQLLEIEQEERELFNALNGKPLPVTLILSHTGGTLGNTTYVRRLYDLIAARNYPGLRLIEADYSPLDHGSMYLPHFRDSLGILMSSAAPPAQNYAGIWWKSPAGSESGWGINFAHQGDTIFATWFTYDATGKGWWLTMTATKNAQGAYTGTIDSYRGPAFSATPFNPSAVVTTPVGNGTLTFADADNGSFTYTVNGITQTKAITKSVFASPVPTCTFSAQANLSTATNYQDIWWAAPAGAESGWGVNFTHQGDVIYATWFTYDVDGSPLWLSAAASRTSPGVYTGTLSRYTGPAFSAVPWLPANVVATPVGTLTLTFANGNSATYAYTVTLSGPASSVTQSKSIVRTTIFVPSGGTVCQ